MQCLPSERRPCRRKLKSAGAAKPGCPPCNRCAAYRHGALVVLGADTEHLVICSHFRTRLLPPILEHGLHPIADGSGLDLLRRSALENELTDLVVGRNQLIDSHPSSEAGLMTVAAAPSPMGRGGGVRPGGEVPWTGLG